mmetsp:Transcript_36213/g.69926  ORF Transcript_36213/g.69926 Transcript_36213/m.69926 type:complete len:80 (+) Transcript_36213:713-952(+)
MGGLFTERREMQTWPLCAEGMQPGGWVMISVLIPDQGRCISIGQTTVTIVVWQKEIKWNVNSFLLSTARVFEKVEILST